VELAGAHRVMQLCPCSMDASGVLELLAGLGPADRLVDQLSAVAGWLVVSRYAAWHLQGGRLETQAPSNWDEARVLGARSTRYRLPFETLLR